MANESPPTRETSLPKALGLLALLLAVAALLLWLAYRAIASLDSPTAAAVITASATVLISVGSLIYSRRAEQRRTIDEHLRERKTAIYDEFMGFWFGMFFADLFDQPEPTEKEIGQFSIRFNQKALLWAPDAFLVEYNRFRAEAVDTVPTTMFALERVLYEIRSDLGHKNKGLERGDLLRLFIHDVDQHLA